MAVTSAHCLSLNAQNMDHTVYQFTMQDIEGKEVPLSTFKGKALLIVNVASECGLTPQYEDLQALYEEFKDQGLAILGFPANNFGAQEPGSNAEIQKFCTTRFHVTFPMFSKISVKGEDEHPLYQFLTRKELNGVEDSEVKWNFQKYLVSKEGRLLEVIQPGTSVKEAEVRSSIREALR
jgi:glutathione peroxidase